MTFTDLLPWFNPVMAIASLIYTWVATRDKDNSKHIKAVEDALSKRIADHAVQLSEQRLTIEGIKAEQRHMPTHRDISALQERLAGIERMGAMQAEQIKAVFGSIESLREFLLANPIPKKSPDSPNPAPAPQVIQIEVAKK